LQLGCGLHGPTTKSWRLTDGATGMCCLICFLTISWRSLDDLLMTSWTFNKCLSICFESRFSFVWICVEMRLRYIPKGAQRFFAVPVVFDMSGCAKAPYWIRTSPRMYRPNASRKVGRRQHHLISLAESLTFAQALETGIIQIRSNKCCTSCKILGVVSCSLQRIDRLVDRVFQPFVKLCQARDVISFILFLLWSQTVPVSTVGKFFVVQHFVVDTDRYQVYTESLQSFFSTFCQPCGLASIVLELQLGVSKGA
jgi:hypothetical protein